MNKLSGILPSRSFKHTCEWCGKEYFGMKFSKLCSRKCMYEQRKSRHWEVAICKHCGNEFSRRKSNRNWRNGKKQMFCSNECNRSSNYKKRKLVSWGTSDKNHWNNPDIQKKVRETKLRVYGDTNYNNQEKIQNTTMERYGVHNILCLLKYKTNGKRISNIQRKIFNETKKKYKDALLEHYLSDVKMSVDIFIPKTNQVIEVFGDYWHMNPRLYNQHDFNNSTKLTAEETWNRDKERICKLQSAGYDVQVMWENH